MKVKLLVEGGNMKPGPAIAQQLGPMGVNLGKVISDVNSATAGFKGVTVPVQLDVDTKTKKYTIEVFSPPMSELIKKELKLDKGSGESGKIMAANIAIEQLIGIAKTKMSGLLAKDLKAGVKLAVGSCVSLGVMVESKPAKEVIADIDSGIYDKEISGEIASVSPEKRRKLDLAFKKVAAEQEKKKKEEEAAAAEAEAAKATAVAKAGEGEEKTGKEDEKAAESAEGEEKEEEKK